MVDRNDAFDDETDAMLISSKALLLKMEAKGITVQRFSNVTHLLVGDDNNIAGALKVLSQRGFEVLESSDQRLLVGEQVVPSEMWIDDRIPEMCLIAGEFDLIYDGWDVDVATVGSNRVH